MKDDWNGWWTANSSLPAFQTVQEIVDPNKNTTSTSTACNSAAFSSAIADKAVRENYDPYNNCVFLNLNDDCDLVCIDGRVPAGADNFTV